ncbi:MAG: hypothetical protein DRH08_05865 [Deltaproteobacteria bacterium]|nr:MAG: hypothetical protein DRH08_05865 [Deltaproteobacteria bacterium]
MQVPVLAALPNGNVLMLLWKESSTQNTGTFDLYVTRDNGATWELSAPSVVTPYNLDWFTLVKARMAYGGPGELLLMLHMIDNGGGVPWTPVRGDVLHQWASADLGASFQAVFAQTGLNAANPDPNDPLPQDEWQQAGGFPEVVADRAGFLVLYAEPNLGDYPASRRLASAFESFASAQAVYLIERVMAINNPYSVGSNLAATADNNGTIWAYFTEALPANDDAPLSCLYSNDSGHLWVPAPRRAVDEARLASFSQAAGAAAHWTLDHYAACWDRGRVVLIHSYTAQTDYRQTLSEVLIGGWAAPPAPIDIRATSPGELASQAPQTATYFPMELPDALGWTLNGTPNPTIDGAKLTMTTGGIGSAGFYSQVLPAAHMDGGASSALFDVRVSAGALGVFVSCSADFNHHGYGLVTDAGLVELRDSDGTLKQSHDFAVAGRRIQIAIGARGALGASATIAMWARVVDSTDGLPYDAPWVYVGAFSQPAQTIDPYDVRFGNLGLGGFDNVSNEGEIYECSYRTTDAFGGFYAKEGWDGAATPSLLPGRAMTVIAEHARDGLYLSARGGPTFNGDTWDHAPFFDFGVGNLSPLSARSPSQPWVASELGDAAFAWDFFENEAGEDTLTDTPVFGVHVAKTNHPTWKLEGYDAFNGVWIEVAAWDTRDSFSTIFGVRFGDAVSLDELAFAPVDAPLAPLGYYIAGSELVGGTIYIDDDAQSIVRNTGGIVSPTLDQTTTVPPRVFVDDAVPGGAQGSVTVRIAPPNFTVLVRVDGHASGSRFRGWRLTAVRDPTAPTNEPLPRIGSAVMGSASLFGMEYDLTKTVTRRFAVDVDQDASGQVTTRKRGPSRRLAGVRWGQGGIWTRGVYELVNDEYAKFSDAASAWPVALLHDGSKLVESIGIALEGPHVPFVLLRKVPKLVDPATFIVLARDEAGGAIYGHLTTSLAFSVESGEYAHDERTSFGFDIEEEV